MSDDSIPSLKASPEHIVDLMRIVKNNTDDLDRMKQQIHRYLSEKAIRGRRNERNSVYAITFPSLRRLGLIEERGRAIRLTIEAENLLKIYDEKDLLAFKKAFAKLILRIDMEQAHVIESILSYGKSKISIQELLKILDKRGMQFAPKSDRLTKWLRYLKYADFVNYENGMLEVNNFQIESIRNGAQPVKFDTFLKIFLEAYESLKARNKGISYVKIPDLKREVCERLSNYDFTTFDFHNSLKKLKGSSIDGKRIVFSRPGAREEGGLKIGNVYYYYISVFGGSD